MATKTMNTDIPEEEVRSRLLQAFPEIDFDNFIDESGTNNRHNVEEKFAATVKQVHTWIKPAQAK